MASNASSAKIDTIVSLCKRRGFVYPSGEIYGGTRSAWDYGPLGRGAQGEHQAAVVAVHGHRPRRRRRPRLARSSCPRRSGRPPATSASSSTRWSSASRCHKRFRADHLHEAYAEKHRHSGAGGRPVRRRLPQLRHPRHVHRAADVQHAAQDLPRPDRGRVGPGTTCGRRPRRASSSTSSTCMTTLGRKPPFGIGQIGKCFRNEITPGNFIFRTREFEQMEMEFFVEPGTDEEWHEYWIDERTALVRRPGHRPGQPAALRAPEGEALALLQAHRRHRVPVRVHRRSGASSRASPTAPTST